MATYNTFTMAADSTESLWQQIIVAMIADNTATITANGTFSMAEGR